jgi:hypothetical protein
MQCGRQDFPAGFFPKVGDDANLLSYSWYKKADSLIPGIRFF